MIDLSEQAKIYIKRHKKDLINKFADITNYLPIKNPETFFMAGSPGAGKTEFAHRFSKELKEKQNISAVVIDPDEIRAMLPCYNGKNSELFQGAVCLGIDKIYDHNLHKRQTVIIDGTLAHFKTSEKNIERSIGKNRKISIFYLYQDPILAWKFTKIREELDRRFMPKNVFTQAFFDSKDNANKLKAMYNKYITLNLIIKNFNNDIEKTHFNIPNIDNYLKLSYDKLSLMEKLC